MASTLVVTSCCLKTRLDPLSKHVRASGSSPSSPWVRRVRRPRGHSCPEPGTWLLRVNAALRLPEEDGRRHVGEEGSYVSVPRCGRARTHARTSSTPTPTHWSERARARTGHKLLLLLHRARCLYEWPSSPPPPRLSHPPGHQHGRKRERKKATPPTPTPLPSAYISHGRAHTHTHKKGPSRPIRA